MFFSSIAAIASLESQKTNTPE